MKNSRVFNTKDRPEKLPSRKLKVFFSVFLIGGVLLGASTVPSIVLLDHKSCIFFASTYKMQEDAFSNPRLQLLRRREHLDTVVAQGKTQFEKIVLLRRWTRQQWEGGQSFYYPAWDAVEILDLVKKYK